MKTSPRSPHRTLAPIASVIALSIAMVALLERQAATGQVAGEVPAGAPDAQVELATLMGELQRLTHKLSLAVRHGNHDLSDFYLYESLESVTEIQERVPEYRGLPVAVLLDQIARPAYATLESALEADRQSPAGEGAEPAAPAAMAALVGSCNQCHLATRHGFIKITDPGEVNPFNQDFAP